MWIDLSAQPGPANYGLMTQTILPRPIAWILSRNAGGNLNLAPFSYFMAVASDPPTVAFSIGSRADGQPKDTRANILAGRPFVIHLGHLPQAAALNQSAAQLPSGESELEALDLPTLPFEGSEVPRLAAAPVAFAARYQQHVLIGERRQALILAELRHAHVDDGCVVSPPDAERLVIDARRLQPLARLGRNEYGALGDVFAMERPS